MCIKNATLKKYKRFEYLSQIKNHAKYNKISDIQKINILMITYQKMKKPNVTYIESLLIVIVRRYRLNRYTMPFLAGNIL